MNPDADSSSWRRAMFDERVRMLHGKISGNRKYGGTRVCVVVQVGAEKTMIRLCVFQVRRDNQPNPVEDSVAWRSSFTPQTWKAEVCLCVFTVPICLNTLSHLLNFE